MKRRKREGRASEKGRKFQFRMMVMQQQSMGVPPPPFSPGFNYGLQSSSSSNRTSQQWSESDM